MKFVVPLTPEEEVIAEIADVKTQLNRLGQTITPSQRIKRLRLLNRLAELQGRLPL